MFTKIKSLYNIEWFKLLKPSGLVTQVIRWLGSLLDVTNVTPIYQRLQNTPLLRGYTYVCIAKEDIQYIDKNSIVAGGSDVAKTYRYRVTSISDNFEILGCGFTSKYAVKGIDYVIVDNCYWFKYNPIKYFNIMLSDDRIYLTTIGYGGSHVAGKEYLTDLSTNPVNLVEHSAKAIANGLGLQGLCGSFGLALKGIYISKPVQGKVIKTWQEPGYICAITQGGTFICAPVDSGIKLTLDAYPQIDKDPESLFVVELNNEYYPVSMDINYLDNYPNILTTYPGLRSYGDDLFIGRDLYNILKNQGCNFTELKYINTKQLNSTAVKTIGSTIIKLPSHEISLKLIAGDAVVQPIVESSDEEKLIVNDTITVNYV